MLQTRSIKCWDHQIWTIRKHLELMQLELRWQLRMMSLFVKCDVYDVHEDFGEIINLKDYFQIIYSDLHSKVHYENVANIYLKLDKSVKRSNKTINIFIQFLMYINDTLIVDFGMSVRIYRFKIIFKILLFSKDVGASCYSLCN